MVAVALGSSVGIASSAYADPSGCTVYKPTISLSTNGRLSAGVSAYCNTSKLRYLRGEIKWDKNFAPDPLTGSYTDSGYQLYDASFYQCDNQNTRKYYARGFFTSGSDYHDSDHRVLTVNC